MGQLIQKDRRRWPTGVQRKVRRNPRAWVALYGIWRGKKIPHPSRWQREIRREWERKLR